MGETVLGEIDALVGQKPDCVIVHAGASNTTESINALNTVRKIELILYLI